jgi:CheY-like chemotaxis protein
MPSNLPVTIVLVEDDAGHARLIERNLRRAHITNDITVLGDGQEAVDYFFKEAAYAGAEHALPLLVLLDLNLPGLDGYQVLARLKSDERTRQIPVIVLTTTDDPREVERCYALGCNVYITKPVEYEQFSEAIRRLGLFLSVVKIPNGGWVSWYRLHQCGFSS